MNRWILGARPRTLGAAVAPVAVGTAAASRHVDVSVPRAVATLVVALALQIATNFANDYSDGKRGVDGPQRVGPVRLVGSGLATASEVKRAMLAAFGVAAVVGAGLALVAEPGLLVAGLLCLAAAWFYTGGPKPYGYAGMGEVAVFVFFGLVATGGTEWVQLERPMADGFALGVPIGLLSVALLVVNNLRDIATDAPAGKRTLAVRLGDRRTRVLFAGCLVGAGVAVVVIAIAIGAPVLLGLVAAPLGVQPVRAVLSGAVGPALLPVLGASGRVLLVGGLLLTAGVALTA